DIDFAFTGALANRAHSADDFVDEGLVNRRLHVNSLDRGADLAAVHQGTPHTAPAARSRSASFKMIIGSLPPSSSDMGINRSAARRITSLPVSTLPVKAIMSAQSTSASPVAP